MNGADAHHLVDHLFRDRAGQMVAWLTCVFGPAHLQLAEEVVQDALVKALQQWPFSGVPDNPAGWLFRVARNGALDVSTRDIFGGLPVVHPRAAVPRPGQSPALQPLRDA